MTLLSRARSGNGDGSFKCTVVLCCLSVITPLRALHSCCCSRGRSETRRWIYNTTRPWSSVSHRWHFTTTRRTGSAASAVVVVGHPSRRQVLGAPSRNRCTEKQKRSDGRNIRITNARLLLCGYCFGANNITPQPSIASI